MKYLFILLLLTLSLSAIAQEKLDHLIFNTNKGPIVIEMDNIGTPEHFDGITKMVELGIYSGMNLTYAGAGFYVQMGEEEHREYGFYPEQKELIKPFPHEATDFKHYRGVVTMPARPEEELRGGSFQMTFLLDRSESLDGKQTIIGHVVSGLDILDELSHSPAENEMLKNPLTITNAFFMEKEAALAYAKKANTSAFNSDIVNFGLFAFLAIILIQLLIHFGKEKIDKQISDSLQLVVLLIATFAFLAKAYPMVSESTFASVGFVGLMILCFKVMASLERSRGLTK